MSALSTLVDQGWGIAWKARTALLREMDGWCAPKITQTDGKHEQRTADVKRRRWRSQGFLGVPALAVLRGEQKRRAQSDRETRTITFKKARTKGRGKETGWYDTARTVLPLPLFLYGETEKDTKMDGWTGNL